MPEILIVGAGVAGSSIAFHLAERGASGVTVIDARHVAAGMSSRSSALVRMHYTYPPEVDLAVESLAYFRAWPDRVGGAPVFRQTGFVRLVLPTETEQLRRNVAMQQARGADVHLISPDELLALAPGWSVTDVAAAAYEPASGYGDGALVASDFLARARELGAAYQPGNAAHRLIVERGRVRGVVTGGGPVHADVTVLATGVWTGALLGSAGIPAPIELEYHEVAVLRAGNGVPLAPVACIDSATACYFRPEGDGQVLVGEFTGSRGSHAPDALPSRPSDESLARIAGRAAGRAPAFANAGIVGGATGLYDMTPDARPLLGPLPGVDGMVLAAGFSGMGFKISPAVGRTIAALILDGPAQVPGIAPFRPSRFAEGQPIVPDVPYSDD
jgi:sarcosine oxidase, subunit beta